MKSFLVRSWLEEMPAGTEGGQEAVMRRRTGQVGGHQEDTHREPGETGVHWSVCKVKRVMWLHQVKGANHHRVLSAAVSCHNFCPNILSADYMNIWNYPDSNDIKNWLMKRWNIHILLAKPCLASKENITIQKLYGTIRYKPHLIPVDHLTEPVEIILTGHRTNIT